MPMLIDFGAARSAIAQQSQTISAIVKEGYSPPEQYTSNANQTAATDVYALGAVFYRMITGNKSTNASLRQMALLKGDADPIGNLVENYKSKYSQNLLEAVMKALDIHQERRFQSISEFQKAISTGVPIIKGEGNKGNGTEKGSNKGVIVGLLAALLLAVVVVVPYIAKKNPSSPTNSGNLISEEKIEQEEKYRKQKEELEALKAERETRRKQELQKKKEKERKEREAIRREKEELQKLKREREDRARKNELAKLREEVEREKREAERLRKQAKEPREKTISFNENGIHIQLKYPSSVYAGQEFTLKAEMTNNNQRAKQGGLTLSFPDMNSMPGRSLGSNFSSLKGYSHPDKIYNKNMGRNMKTKYFMVEGWHSKSWYGGGTKYYSVKLRAPSGLDELRVNLRGILWIRGSKDTRKIPYSSSIYDQQGFPVKRFKIKIKR